LFVVEVRGSLAVEVRSGLGRSGRQSVFEQSGFFATVRIMNRTRGRRVREVEFVNEWCVVVLVPTVLAPRSDDETIDR